MRKMDWLPQGLRIVNFRWNQVSLWQHNMLRETSFYICMEKEKNIASFLLPLKRDKNVWHLQPISSIWSPLAFLLLIPPFSFRRIMLPRDKGHRSRSIIAHKLTRGVAPKLVQWAWVWVNSGSWWWTGRPGMLWFMWSQRGGSDWTELF